MDGLRRHLSLRELEIRLAHMKADLACIQETHDANTKDLEIENYRYISTAAQPVTGKENEKGIGGWQSSLKKNGATT